MNISGEVTTLATSNQYVVSYLDLAQIQTVRPKVTIGATLQEYTAGNRDSIILIPMQNHRVLQRVIDDGGHSSDMNSFKHQRYSVNLRAYKDVVSINLFVPDCGHRTDSIKRAKWIYRMNKADTLLRRVLKGYFSIIHKGCILESIYIHRFSAIARTFTSLYSRATI